MPGEKQNQLILVGVTGGSIHSNLFFSKQKKEIENSKLKKKKVSEKVKKGTFSFMLSCEIVDYTFVFTARPSLPLLLFPACFFSL